MMSNTLRHNLFNLFAVWSGKLGYPFVNTDKRCLLCPLLSSFRGAIVETFVSQHCFNYMAS